MDRRLRTYQQIPGRCSGLLVLRFFTAAIFIYVFKTNVIAYGCGKFCPPGGFVENGVGLTPNIYFSCAAAARCG